jgi:hypothetical protein
MTDPPIVDVLRQVVLPVLDGVRPAGGGYLARCPVPGHGKGGGDRHPSLSVGRGDLAEVVFRCQANTCTQDDIRDALVARGVDWSLVSRPRTERPADESWLPCHRDRGPAGHALIESYPYVYPDGRLSYTVTRCAAKCFAQWRPDPTSRSGRRWSITERSPDGGSRRVVPYLPFRLPQVLAAIGQGMCVWITEGERDALALAKVGIAGTCNSGGAGKWTGEHAEHLAGADVVVVMDRDRPGLAHAEQVVDTLMPLARSIEVVRAGQGKDARDHLDAGLRIHEFVQVAVPLPAPVAVPGCPDCAREAEA